MAVYSSERLYATRETVAEFLGFDYPERIIFTMNATHALNLAIKGLIRHKCHVITSDMEHNSVVRPLNSLKELYGVEVSEFDTDLDIESAVIPLIRPDTEFVVSTAASNVTGKTVDISGLSNIGKRYGITIIIDASQLLGHRWIDLKKTPVDVVCAPAHKSLFGIQGGGFALFSTEKSITPLLEGGSGGDSKNLAMPTALPERLEAGTVNLPSIVSLGAGIKYLQAIGEEGVSSRLIALTEKARDVLQDLGAMVYGCENGIVSFELCGITPMRLGNMLDLRGVAVRSGLHCAPAAHKKLMTENRGLVRMSFSLFNTEREVDYLYRVLKEIKNEARQD